MSAWGSTIRIRATEGSSPPAAGIRSACEYEYGVSDGPRILVVDDDEDIRILLRELLARIQALLRRSGGKSEVTESYRDAFVEIDYPQRRVVVGEREVQLTPLEFKLLSAFVQHPNQVLARDQLLELVWGDPYGVSGDQVKLYVGYLRKKLDPTAPDAVPVETVRGFGYRYRRT